MHHIICLFLTLAFLLPLSQAHAQDTLIFNLFTINNGRGLQNDAQLLQTALQSLRHTCNIIDMSSVHQEAVQSDINIFFQQIDKNQLNKARLNWFIPNPEWFAQRTRILKKVDLILCRTHEVERIFQRFHVPTYYLGFTSHDRYDPLVQKNYEQYLHMPGSSLQKGTKAILQLWRKHPNPPFLILLKHDGHIHNLPNSQEVATRLPEEELITLQNQSGIHLCPSETEGFGHYIMEAMSTGSVVITTDAPPMNEFIRDKRCLVGYKSTFPLRLSTNYKVDAEELEKTIDSLQTLSPQELAEIGLQNRKMYLKKSKGFLKRLKHLLYPNNLKI